MIVVYLPIHYGKTFVGAYMFQVKKKAGVHASMSAFCIWKM